MNQLLAKRSALALLFPLLIWPVQSQAQGPSQRTAPPMPSVGTSPPSQNRSPSRPMDNVQGPIYISGRILTETGKPPAESVSVELNCGMRPLQVIHTDLGGYFTFSLGSGGQNNTDFSASNENPLLAGNGAGGASFSGASGGSLTGCEVRVSVAGYHPLSFTVSQHADMGRVEIGTLQLRRISGVEGSAISATSLLVPNSARKEFEKGEKEIRNNHPEAAQQHLEKAVTEYDKFAAAWNELGRVYLSSKDPDKAREAFQKAISADRQYIPPYMSLATLELQSRHYEQAAETAGKLLELDQSFSYASFIQAIANFNLNRLDDAEKYAREAEKGTLDNPQLHALLAEILLQKQDYRRASTEMRSYLAQAPTGQYAAQMKKDLEVIQNAESHPAAEANALPEESPEDLPAEAPQEEEHLNP